MRVLVPGCCQEPGQNCSHHRTSLDILCAPYWSVINLDSHRLAVYRTIHILNLQTSAGSPANQETRIYKTVRNDPPRKPDSRINTRRRSHRTPHPPSLCTRPYSDKPPPLFQFTMSTRPPTCCKKSDGECTCALQARCSCGEREALHCNCSRAGEENTATGPRCSCRGFPSFLPSPVVVFGCQ